MSPAVRDATVGRAASALGAEPDLLPAIVFGSVVRGEAGFGSDLDVVDLMGEPISRERRQGWPR